jgi:serine/threonine protein phosphatase PrpC
MSEPSSPNRPRVVSAAGVKRLMRYSSIEHRAQPSSPTFRRTRQAPMFLSRSGLDTTPSTQRGGTSPLHSPLGVPPSLASIQRLRVQPTFTSVGSLDRHEGSHVFESGPLTLGSDDAALVLEVMPDTDEIVKDFYESELLLYRNFGIEQEADEAPPESNSNRTSRAGRSDSRCDDAAVLSPARREDGSRRSSRTSPLNEPTSSLAAERKLGMRRRGSAFEGDSDSNAASPCRERRGSPSAPINTSFTAFTEPAAISPADDTPFTTDRSGNDHEFTSPTGNSSRPNSRGSQSNRHLSVSGNVQQSRRRSLRGSWSEQPSGAPRALTSSVRRTFKTVSVVDLDQEFHRYTSQRGGDQSWDGACECDEETIGRHIGKLRAEDTDFHKHLHHCSWCRRRPACFLCLSCGAGLCPSHVRAHALDDNFVNCALFINVLDIATSYDRIYWCERCTQFTFKFTDPYCAVADALVHTRGTYFKKESATDIFMRHYQIQDQSRPPVGEAVPAENAVSTKIIASVASVQGWRTTQEDSEVVFYITRSSLASAPYEALDYFDKMSCFCVFDGHGGDAVAKIASHAVEHHFIESLSFVLSEATGPFHAFENREDVYRRAFELTLRALDEAILATEDGSQGFYGTVGCTALIVLVSPHDIACASLGDSRACLFDVNRAKCVALSQDHTLDDETEVQRAVEAGYKVVDGRIEGQLAVPRALGDFDFKQCGGKLPHEQAVSNLPMVTCIDRKTLALAEGEEPVSTATKLPPMRSAGGVSSSPVKKSTQGQPEEWFLVAACDGVWDVLTNEDCCTLLNESFQQSRRDKQLETFVSAQQGHGQVLGITPGSPSARSDSSPKSTDGPGPSIPMRRSRPGSLRGMQHHPANNVILYANTLNDIIGTSICTVLKRTVALDKKEDDPAGLDNMSIIVARVCLTV